MNTRPMFAAQLIVPTRLNGRWASLAILAMGASLLSPVLTQSASPQSASPQTAASAVKPLQLAQSTALAGSWRLANMTAGNLPTPMLPSEELTAEFASGRIAGSGGCNRFTGSYETTGQNLSIGPLATTFKACESSISTQETRYLQALQGAQRYAVTDQGLTIDYQTEEGAGVLRFVQAGGAPESTPESTQGGGTRGTQEGIRGLW